jgi:hypothetical protein
MGEFSSRGLRAGVASAAVAFGLLASSASLAAPTYQNGRINNVTFSSSSVMIMLDTGLPDNCVGSPYGWMVIPQEYKAMVAFVISLWMSGNAGTTPVTVYTDGLVNGYCRINQVDP